MRLGVVGILLDINMSKIVLWIIVEIEEHKQTRGKSIGKQLGWKLSEIKVIF